MLPRSTPTQVLITSEQSMSAIRQTLDLEARPRAIWKKLSTPEGWMDWYADDARLDLRVGGRIVLTSEDDEGEPVEEVGLFHALRPPSRMQIRWDGNSPAETRGGTLNFTLADRGGRTRLSLVHSGGEVLQDEEKRAELQDTWRMALKALKGAVES